MLIYLLACTTEAPPAPEASTPPPGPATPFVEGPSGFVATHPGMGTTSTISDAGVHYAGSDWELLLRPLDLGRPMDAEPFSLRSARLEGERVVAGDHPMFWALHDERGLEFGLDVTEPPPGHGPLRVRFGIDGLKNPYGTGTDVSFDTGSALVHLDGLVVSDADGTTLDAQMRADCLDEEADAVVPCELVIEVDDSYARYPLVIDPWLTTEPRTVTPRVTASDSLVITELMINPTSVDDRDGEWIEITNAGSQDVVLDDLAIWDDGNNYFQMPPIGAVIPPGGTYVFGRNANPAQNGGVAVDMVASTIQLANSVDDAPDADEVIIGLRASDDACDPNTNPCIEIDRVVLDAEWRHTVTGLSPFLPAGGSLSLDPSALTGDNDLRANWCDGLAPYGTGMFGTPNAPNASCAFGLEFDYSFDLVGGGTAAGCTWVRPELDGSMTTDNRGEGSYQRYTRASGQTLTWTYQYNGSPQPANPTVYTGTRLFGSSTWSLGDIIDFDPSIATDGSWSSPCTDPGDTGDTGTPGPGGMLFTQYVEGNSNNKYLEIQNLSGAPVTTDGCSVKIYFNGSTSSAAEVFLGVGTLADDGIFVLCNSSATVPASGCNVSSGSLAFNGDDAVELTCNNTTLDVIGQIGFDPGSFWGTDPVNTEDSNLRRQCTVTSGDPDGSDAFQPSQEWDAIPVVTNDDYRDDLGQHICP